VRGACVCIGCGCGRRREWVMLQPMPISELGKLLHCADLRTEMKAYDEDRKRASAPRNVGLCAKSTGWLMAW
jgi:hypothetical protein